MKKPLQTLLRQAAQALAAGSDGILDTAAAQITPQVETCRNPDHGDFASNIAFLLAKQSKSSPQEIARRLRDWIRESAEAGWLEKVEVAGAGFVNFSLSADAWLSVLPEIQRQGAGFGAGEHGKQKTVLLEFVSANPTGPLHVGHGRGAAFGAALANLLRKTGFDVHCEYYVNDAGRQIDILAVSVWLRYLRMHQVDCPFPENAYQGDYVQDIAARLTESHARDFVTDPPPHPALERDHEAENGEQNGARAEAWMDELIRIARQNLGEPKYERIREAAVRSVLDGIRSDLHTFRAGFQTWFSERGLLQEQRVADCVRELQEGGHCYTQEGAVWFRSSAHGDEKDRVLIRSNGQYTYFATDIAYHIGKFERGFDRMINIWGADHHGYVARLRAALHALGKPTEALEILLVQFASLRSGGKKLSMSTRGGEFVSLRELFTEVGVDAARFFYSMRRCEQHLDFDLDLAKSRNQENPVYYVQYAHARICGVQQTLKQRGMEFRMTQTVDGLRALDSEQEQILLKKMAAFGDVIEAAAKQHEPHQLLHYLQDLAHDFHSWYNAQQFLIEDADLRNARLTLMMACKTLFANGLALLDVTAPENM